MLPSLVSVEWLKENILNPKLIVLDASIESKLTKKTSYPGIQIEDARFFDLKNNFSDQYSELPNTLPTPEAFASACRKLGVNQDSIIVVYDNLGIYFSPRAWFMFKIMGFQNVAVLDGGLPEWIKNGFQTETILSKTYKIGNFTVSYQSDLIVTKKDILKNIEEKKAIVLDARLKTRFYAQVPEPRASIRSGHIPNSMCLPYGIVLKDGKFLPLAELKIAIDVLDLKNKPLIFTCGSGMTACIILLACNLVLDNKMSVYDGSWTEWGGNNELPISTE